MSTIQQDTPGAALQAVDPAGLQWTQHHRCCHLRCRCCLQICLPAPQQLLLLLLVECTQS
jgi:hypothetical protein